jgi:hypothetical protein
MSMAKSAWDGLYLRTSLADAKGALIRLAQGRHYSLVEHIELLDLVKLDEVRRRQYHRGTLDNIEVFFLLQTNRDWTRLVGFERLYTVLPQLMFPSELVMMLGCDALQCGFYEKEGWYYTYYQQGVLADAFESQPVVKIEMWPSMRDPFDVRTVCLACLWHEVEGVEPGTRVNVPHSIINQFRGNPEVLLPILRDGQKERLGALLIKERNAGNDKLTRIGSAGRAIQQFGDMVIFPDINQLDLYDLIGEEQFINYPPGWKDQLVQQRLSLVVVEHPKGRLELDSSTPGRDCA